MITTPDRFRARVEITRLDPIIPACSHHGPREGSPQPGEGIDSPTIPVGIGYKPSWLCGLHVSSSGDKLPLGSMGPVTWVEPPASYRPYIYSRTCPNPYGG